MEPFVYVTLAFCAVMVSLLVGTGIFAWKLYTKEAERHESEKHELRKLIRDLQNRISAKDLTGYIALRDSETGPCEVINRNDEEMANIEARRRGIA